MRSIVIPGAALALLTFCSPDRNRQPDETGMGRATAGGLSSNDTIPTSGADTMSTEAGRPAAILSQLNVANTTEIQLAGLAERQAATPQVKKVAKKLVADHTRNREELQALAQKLDLDLTSARGGAITPSDSTALPADLEGKSGKSFDQAFVQHEIDEHQAGIEKIRGQLIPAAQNEEIKNYLQKTATAMEGHLASLKQVQQQIGA
jgi:putative membrane protein